MLDRVDRLLHQLEHGRVVVRTAELEAERAVRSLHLLANRIVIGILIAAFIIGLALVILAIRPAASDLWLRLLIVGGFGGMSLA